MESKTNTDPAFADSWVSCFKANFGEGKMSCLWDPGKIKVPPVSVVKSSKQNKVLIARGREEL